jgi:lipoprotein-anchoring transpeptidase ErfK/SrfK
MTTSSRKAARGAEEAVMGDLKAGVDGGSSGEGLPFAFQRQVVFYRTTVVPGSIVVDRENRFLYLVESNNSARRYGIGVADECLKGGSFFRIASKLEWPEWGTAGTYMKDADAQLASTGRPGSLLGDARYCWTSRACSSTARIRQKPSAISSLPDASGWSTTTSRICIGECLWTRELCL